MTKAPHSYPDSSSPRDFDARPYSPDEKRVAAFIWERGLGGGDDPIGFILASYAYVVSERNEARAAASDEIRQLRMDNARLRDEAFLRTRAAAQGAQQPVAWRVDGKRNGLPEIWFYYKPEWPPMHEKHGDKVTPLYASPLSSTEPRCTCAAIVNPNIPHARFCPLSSTDRGGK